MANKANLADNDSGLPELPSVIKNSVLIEYLEEFNDVTPPTGITYSRLIDNSRSFPRYENIDAGQDLLILYCIIYKCV